MATQGTRLGKKLSAWKKNPNLLQSIAQHGGEGMSLTKPLETETHRLTNSQPLIRKKKKKRLYNMDSKY